MVAVSSSSDETGGSYQLMCTCECHRACTASAREGVNEEDWLRACTCPGAALRKEIHDRVRKEGEERKILKGEARAEVKALSPEGPSADPPSIRRRLRATGA